MENMFLKHKKLEASALSFLVPKNESFIIPKKYHFYLPVVSRQRWM